jgi:hypothetical protein
MPEEDTFKIKSENNDDHEQDASLILDFGVHEGTDIMDVPFEYVLYLGGKKIVGCKPVDTLASRPKDKFYDYAIKYIEGRCWCCSDPIEEQQQPRPEKASKDWDVQRLHFTCYKKLEEESRRRIKRKWVHQDEANFKKTMKAMHFAAVGRAAAVPAAAAVVAAATSSSIIDTMWPIVRQYDAEIQAWQKFEDCMVSWHEECAVAREEKARIAGRSESDIYRDNVKDAIDKLRDDKKKAQKAMPMSDKRQQTILRQKRQREEDKAHQKEEDEWQEMRRREEEERQLWKDRARAEEDRQLRQQLEEDEAP